MRRHLFAVLLVAAVASVAAPAASADSFVVQHDRYTVEDSGVAQHLCAFPVAITSTANIDDALFFDAQGNLVRLVETVNHVAINYSANGKTLTAIGTGGIEYTFNPDGSLLASTFGINLLLTIPGEGVVFLDAGRALFLFDPHLHVLFQAGPASYDTAAFCAALSP